MASKVSICNQALSLLGANHIVSLSDGTTEANMCDALFDDVRDSVLRAHPWNCAVGRVSLNKLTSTPAYGYTAEYTLPTDPYCLRVLDVNDEEITGGISWKVEGRKLLASVDTIKIRYIQRLTDPGQFDPLLVSAIAARLAAEMSYAIVQSNTVTQGLWQLYNVKIEEAKAYDSLEGTSRVIVSDNLELSRA